jgi:lipid A 3-O-deacylase
MNRHVARALALLALFFPSWAYASDLGLEVKGGVSYHDFRFIAADPVEEGLDVNLELLFPAFEFTKPIFSPRPHIGAQVNVGGRTSQVYAGLTWTFYLTDGIWFAPAVGGSINNGETTRLGLTRKALGSPVLFRLSAELGVDLTENVNASLYYDHESNAFLADLNPGLDNAGVRLGYRF